MKNPIQCIVFDAYGTLFNINSLDDILITHFGEQAAQLSSLWRRKQLEYTWLRTLMGNYKPFSEVTMEALSNSCTNLGLSFDNNIKEQLYTEYLRLEAYSEVHETLQNLSKLADLAVLSNADHKMLDGAIARNHLQAMFKQVLSVEEVRVFKPRPEVYQMACDHFHLEPSNIIFISSNTWDVAGARSFGFHVAWLNRSGGITEELDHQPNFVLEGMGQLLSEGGKEIALMPE